MVSDTRTSGIDRRPAHDPPEPGNVRLLRLAVYIMGVLLVVGVIVVFGTIIWRTSTMSRTAAAGDAAQGFAELDVDVAPGTLISQIQLDGDRMAVHVTKDSADEILIIDIRRGELLGRVNLKEKSGAQAQ